MQVQHAILLVVLTGFTIPFFDIQVFGWKINAFTEDFRKNMLYFESIYQRDVVDQDEGMAMLAARTVRWPSNVKPAKIESKD